MGCFILCDYFVSTQPQTGGALAASDMALSVHRQSKGLCLYMPILIMMCLCLLFRVMDSLVSVLRRTGS